MSSGLVLNTNLNSLVAQNALTSSGAQLAQALQQLSTGLRINTAADDAAGYAIVNGMTAQINGLNQAAQNANDGVSLAQTASGALSEVVNDLQSMRSLAVESLNASNSSSDRVNLDAQFQQLKADINSVASTTQFNGVNLLDGSFQGATFQIGANAGQTITMASVASASASNLGQLYTAAATDPAAYTSTGATGGTAVASGDSGSFTLTIGGKAYTTSAVSLTGTQSTDLTAVAAAINQATGGAGVVATVDSTGKGINLSSTTQQTVTASYTATTGAETLATFGLAASSSLSATANPGVTNYAVTGSAVTSDTLTAGTTNYVATGSGFTDGITAAGNGTASVTIGGTVYTTNTVSVTGTASSDLSAIAAGLNATTTFSSAGYTAGVSGGQLTISSASSSFTGVTAASWTNATTGGSTGSMTLGLAGTTSTATVSGASTGTVTVAIGGTNYTTTALSGLTGTVSNDLGKIVTALNAVSGFSAAGYTASVVGGNELKISGGTTAFTVGSATYAATGGSPGTISLGIAANTAATGTTTGAIPAASVSTIENANVQSVDSSNQVLVQIDAALQQLATTGANLGAYQNRFQAAITGLNTDATNLSSARSQLQDTNYAQATSQLTSAQILQQAGTAMVAQANIIPQNVLTLIQKLP